MSLILDFFATIDPVIGALLATTFTWLVTAAGASVVFLVPNLSRQSLDAMLGFTGGVMVAASFWSLLAPAIEMSERMGVPGWLPAAPAFAACSIALI